MTKQEILAHVDHTLLKPDATWTQIQTLCEEAVQNQTASICINPGYVKPAVAYLQGRIPVCTVIGFPLGATSCESKVFEAKQALADGAAEFDMVIHIGRLKSGNVDYVQHEIERLRAVLPGKVLKVIIETCLLTDDEKRTICEVACNAKVDYVKTSTGFSSGGATVHDVELMLRQVNGRCKVKASGGIRTVSDMETFLEMGCDRLGTSSAVKLLQ